MVRKTTIDRFHGSRERKQPSMKGLMGRPRKLLSIYEFLIVHSERPREADFLLQFNRPVCFVRVLGFKAFAGTHSGLSASKMSEYEKNFNWEKTWLNAPPQRQQQKANTAKAEPHFQHRRRVGPTDTFTLKTHFSQPQDDDYFLLGRRDQKFGSSIVYPLVKRRPKVAGGHPSHEERPDERVAKAAVAHKTKPRTQLPNKGPANLEDAGKSKPPVRHIPRKSTTEAATTLPHKVHRSHTRSHSHHKKRPVERWPEIKLDLPLDSTERPTTTGPKAPRGEQNHIDEPLKEDPKRLSMSPQSQQQQHAPPLISRPRTAPQQAVQTEYQRAYSPPPNYSYTRPGARCTSHTGNLVQHSELTKRTSSPNYSTELQKPTCAPSPQRRSHSASFIDKHKPNALVPANERISTSRQSSKRDFSACNTEPYHASRYLSEYQAKFRNFSDLPLSDERTINAYSMALDERNVAARRRGTTEDSHFSRDHLGQLKSNVLWLWDPQSSTRSINFNQNKREVDQKLQNYQLPPAGMPSSPNESSSHKIAVPTRIPPATRETFPLRPHAQHSATRVDSRKAGVGRRHNQVPVLVNDSIDWILGRAPQDFDGNDLAPGRRLTDLDYTLPAPSFGDQQPISCVNEVIEYVGSSTKDEKTSIFELIPWSGDGIPGNKWLPT
ncbi:hypothetical protein SprV_0401555800 [Sparganum proliferum]